MPIDKSKVTKDMIQKAKQCKTADKLITLAWAGGCGGAALQRGVTIRAGTVE